ncbi:hypothetical protein Ciccas_005696 [Cichlidogyrus casuarinus]|uniref:Uncharacterized protein n=1 Tax=Cichlidogyrus casuarinus TaxID=1844966 RepID=A0ABD2Q7X4_9PLAT
MTFLLVTAICQLVVDYRNYHIAVDTTLHLNQPSEFPSVTICHHQPFNKQAYEDWDKGKGYSPVKFQHDVNRVAKGYIAQKQTQLSTLLFYSATRDVYYQNLDYDMAKKISHNSNIFYSCLRILDNYMSIESNCDLLRGYKLRTYSTGTYFNCHTLTPEDPPAARNTSMLGLILDMGPVLNQTNSRQLFLNDVFEQAQGLRLVIHESDTMPNLAEDGLHIEPGKMNEISYQPIKMKHLDTPKRPCHKEFDKTFFPYPDLDQKFRYTQDICMKTVTQKKIIENCKCIYYPNNGYPRSQMPGHGVPYCAKLTENVKEFQDRINCITKYIAERLDENECPPRCEKYEYESTVSVTKWFAFDWQLHWMEKFTKAVEDFDGKIEEKKESAVKVMLDFFSREDLTKDLDKQAKDIHFDKDGSNSFAYVRVKRKTNNTIKKSEKLVLSLPILLSRIGGLCSLTIGLTAAILVEIVEFLYLLHKNQKTANSSPNDTDLIDGSPSQRDESKNGCVLVTTM